MRIFFLISSIHAGGVGSVLRRLAMHFSGQGHDVHVMSMQPLEDNDERQAQLETAGVQCHSLNIPHINPLSVIVLWWRLYRFIKSEKSFDTAILPGVVYGILGVSVLKAAKQKTHIVVNAHTTFSTYMRGQGILKRAFFAFGRFWIKKADRVVCDSAGGAADLEKSYGLDAVGVIYNPIADDADLQFEEDADKAPHAWLRDESLTCFVACGRLVQSKNFTFMIEVFAKLAAENQNLRLIIIGEGEEKENLQGKIEQSGLGDIIDMVGFSSHPKPYFYHADYFWMTSLHEGFPVTLGEAMAMGTAPIANDCPSGPREMLKGGEFGLLIEGYDADDNSSQIMTHLQQDKYDRDVYRARAADFHVDKIANHYLTVEG